MEVICKLKRALHGKTPGISNSPPVISSCLKYFLQYRKQHANKNNEIHYLLWSFGNQFRKPAGIFLLSEHRVTDDYKIKTKTKLCSLECLLHELLEALLVGENQWSVY